MKVEGDEEAAATTTAEAAAAGPAPGQVNIVARWQ